MDDLRKTNQNHKNKNTSTKSFRLNVIEEKDECFMEPQSLFVSESENEGDINNGTESATFVEKSKLQNDENSMEEEKVERNEMEPLFNDVERNLSRLIDGDDDDYPNQRTANQNNVDDQFNNNVAFLLASEKVNESTEFEDNFENKNLKISPKKESKKNKRVKKKVKSKLTDIERSDSEIDQKQSKKTKRKKLKKSKNSEDLSKRLNKASKIDSKLSSNDSAETGISDSEIKDFNNFKSDVNPFDSENIATKSKEYKMRVSAKKAMDDMQIIQSEQQRLHREAYISVPYHKPKKHTLEEFLQRRTIIKPCIDNNCKSSPIASKIQLKSLKMRNKELEEYAKLMEERAIEAKEFFKSESEEYDIEMKDNSGVLDLPNTVSQNRIHTDVVSNNESEYIGHCEEIKAGNVQLDKDSTHENLFFIENSFPEISEKRVSPDKIIITEVLDLPKLDLSVANVKKDNRKLYSYSSFQTQENEMPAVCKSSFQTKGDILKTIFSENLPLSPSIKGSNDMLIDLDSGELIAKNPNGADSLLERLLSTRKAKKEKKDEFINILSVENGKVKMSNVHINLHNDRDETIVEQKPGTALFKLKNSLKNLITKKRLKVMEQRKACEHKIDDDCEPDDEVHHEIDSEDAFNSDGIDSNDEDDLNENEQANDSKNFEIFEHKQELENDLTNDSEDIEDVSDGSGAFEEKTWEDNYEDFNSMTTFTKKKNRIIKAFQEDSDEDGNVDFFKTPQMNSYITSPKAIAKQPGEGVLFDRDIKNSFFEEVKELITLCSGQFDATQSNLPSLDSVNLPFISQMPITQAVINKKNFDDELLELCSGSFEHENKTNAIQATGDGKGNILLSDDQDNLAEDANEVYDISEVRKSKLKLRKRMRKGEIKLGFSDDEEESNAVDGAESKFDGGKEELEEISEEQVDAFVEYDSEENEIIREMTKKDKVIKAANFVEHEAELSESEWESADEDEENLDDYDIELGDEDVFDKEELRDELGKIHARKMLDEDVRELRKLQDMFVEDEERDGVRRQRQFRWKNAENGFNLAIDRADDDTHGNEESGDEENEHLWRKVRFEREQLLNAQNREENDSIMDATLEQTTVTPTILSSNINYLGTTKKMNIINSKITVNRKVSKKNNPFLIPKTLTTLHQKTARGSFLVRDKDTLTKLTGLTKGGNTTSTIESNCSVGSVSVKSTNTKNFVFTTLTEEEHESMKRKADDLLHSSAECINYMKKPKIEPRRNKCFIDQLL